ncbi:MAG TPA: imelysin family protein [Chitinophagales bacterium]|nr:imelysin family protein [Chitinophagales bacterium]HNF68684.1 imelysin family protein [Chitinophagales bacterium]HNI55052.1 imelysin family protein [Chitinophagales bacterium]HNK98398.1 imelysin family protein [Chitinophagales bacterium]HNM07906.1 imelysin family protein [Chitinophagales bacterium]
MFNIQLKHLLTLPATAIIISSCNNNDDPSDIGTYDFSPILNHVSENVITATYGDLHSKSQSLITAVENFNADRSSTNLEAARQAWRDCRIPWEQSEGFLFGPVSTEGIDPAIDSWPVNVIDLDAVLASGESLTKAYVDALEGTLKGFHTIEYLLWGTDGDKSAAAFTDREFEYLSAVTQSLEGATQQLYDAWHSGGDNFQLNIAQAGTATSIYPSQKSAMQELVNGMIGIADEVANGKINEPLTNMDVTLEESHFSSNSKADFMDNIRSIKNVYLGSYLMDGEGISDYIKSLNSSVDDDVIAHIDAAILAIENIPGDFSDAIFMNTASVEAAQQSVRDLQSILESAVKPLIDNY